MRGDREEFFGCAVEGFVGCGVARIFMFFGGWVYAVALGWLFIDGRVFSLVFYFCFRIIEKNSLFFFFGGKC